MPLLHAAGSTVVTNSAPGRRRGITPRYQLDYTIHRPELRSVDCTAAPNANLQLQADDATDARLSGGEMPSAL